MGLDVPDLDDRAYADLLEDAMKRIPVHAESWTDHNVHDPGVTILELLAWLAESYTYQLDRITDEHRRKYLKLAGVEPRPPRPAEATLSLAVPADLDGHDLPPGEPVVVETPSGDREWFQSDERLALTVARVVAVVSAVEGGLHEHGTANDRQGMHYRIFGTEPRAGDACFFGLDADPFARSDRLDLWIDYHEADLPEPASGDGPVDFEPSHRIVWEHCTTPADWRLERAWEPVPIVTDETNAFTVGGRVRLSRPDDWTDEPIELAGHDRPLHWLRCRLASREAPDRGGICDAEARPEPPEPHYEVPPQFDAVATNVIRVGHRHAVVDERLAGVEGTTETTARPDQQFAVASPPVLDATVSVGGERWTPRPDFAASGPDDRHYVLDEATGTVTFGDGRHGAIPAPGQPVTASYDHGGGTAGNVSSGSDWQFEDPALGRIDVGPRRPPGGGRDAESVEAALARAQTERRVPHRAVTAADYRHIATRTPGLRFGRAAVAADDTADAVRVVVVPYSPPPRRAEPSEGFLQAVERHLRRHSLLTDRVAVVGPTYVDVDVSAAVTTVEDADLSATRQQAIERLESFLAPLSGFGGDGWPFGRPIHRSELYAVLEDVDGVEDVLDLAISTRGESRLDGDGTALPAPGAIDVTVRDRTDACRRGF